jgi:hypothetical protein
MDRRPHACTETLSKDGVRRFYCARCRLQVFVCRACDRAQNLLFEGVLAGLGDAARFAKPKGATKTRTGDASSMLLASGPTASDALSER